MNIWNKAIRYVATLLEYCLYIMAILVITLLIVISFSYDSYPSLHNNGKLILSSIVDSLAIFNWSNNKYWLGMAGIAFMLAIIVLGYIESVRKNKSVFSMKLKDFSDLSRLFIIVVSYFFLLTILSGY